MAYPEFVQPRGPGAGITALRCKKIKVIQVGPELIETASAEAVGNQAQFYAATRLS